MSDSTHIEDQSDLRKYRIEIPNLVDDMGLSVYAFRLYVHFKRVAGASSTGRCTQSTRTLAASCRMSTGQVVAAKCELQDAKLIKITSPEKSHTRTDTVIITDIWQKNFKHFSNKDLDAECSGDEQSVHTVNTHGSTVNAPSIGKSGRNVHTVNTCSPGERSVHTVNTSVHTVNERINMIRKNPEEVVGSQRPDGRVRQQPKTCDEDFLAELQSDPAYKKLDVKLVYAKMVRWCKARNKIPTRRRLIDWLNREDQPIEVKPAFKRQAVIPG